MVLFTAAQSQTKKSEGAHQAEYNARQYDVDGEERPSKTLHDARNVSEINSEVASDSITTEENTTTPVSNRDNLGSSTGTQEKATLNIAGSPIPGSRKQSSASAAAKKESSKDLKATKKESKPEAKKTEKSVANKKKKKR